ncbi:MAG: HAMP domain-containing sensor histidine kinase [Fuerstiella sp.]
MFFLRTIRRRLVTGFTFAFVLLLGMTAAAIWGLERHQAAVERLDYLVHRSPDKARLEAAVTRILRPFAAKIDLNKDAAVRLLQYDYLKKINAAQAEANEFYTRSLDAPRDPELQTLGYGGPHPLLTVTMNAVRRELSDLAALSTKLNFSDVTDFQTRQNARDAIELQVGKGIAAINSTLSRLPEHDQLANVESSLRAEQKESTRVMKNVRLLILVALISYAIALFFGFRWISNPLRAVASGASRIANGDTDYRLPPVFRWKDEFYDLTHNFNRMADRFQESEDQLNAKVEERSRQLVRSERLAGIGFLAAGVAHEINNPLQAMSMAAESVQFRLMDHLDPDHPDAAEIRERLEMIQRESKRCGQITRRLLDFARNERQEKQKEDLTRVVGEVLAMIRPMSRYQDRTIVFERAAPLIIEINASQMKQVVLNLVSNALQATNAGGRVEIRLEEHTDWVVVVVEDDGQGMKQENIVHLFEPFYTTKETGEGTGLGLSITHRIIEDHHGTIDPRSEGPGRGSSFTIRLPRRQPQQKAA